MKRKFLIWLALCFPASVLAYGSVVDNINDKAQKIVAVSAESISVVDSDTIHLDGQMVYYSKSMRFLTVARKIPWAQDLPPDTPIGLELSHRAELNCASLQERNFKQRFGDFRSGIRGAVINEAGETHEATRETIGMFCGKSTAEIKKLLAATDARLRPKASQDLFGSIDK